jgi:hypothetical protein
LSTFEKTGKFITFLLVFTGIYYAYPGYKIQVDNYSLHSLEKDSLIVKQMTSFVSDCQLKYNQFFDYNYQRQVDIYLAHSVDDYAKFNRPDIPEWSSGVAYTTERKIILKPGSYYNPGKYRQTLYHEIAHMYISEISKNGRIPVWLNEGLAMYLSEKEMSWQESIAIGNALSANNLVGLENINSVLVWGNVQAEIAYLQSFLAVQLLISKVGEKAVAQMVRDFSSSYTIDEIFIKHMGYDFFEFEIAYYDDLKSRYRWTSWLQFENILWFSLIIFIFLAYLIIKMRNRKIIREWEEDDFYDLED